MFTKLRNEFKAWIKFRLAIVSKTRGSARAMASLMVAALTAAIIAIFYAKICELAFEGAAYFSEHSPVLFVTSAPLLFLISSYLVLSFSKEAGGSGIPYVINEIEFPRVGEKKLPRMIRLVKLICIKMISSVAGILGGGIVGREGPTIQISAAVFDLFDAAFNGFFSNRVTRQALIIAGGSAGLAAAFNTPIGGVVFAIEELSKGHLRTFKGTLILAVITAGYTTQAAIGPYLFIGHPNIGSVSLSDTAAGAVVAAGIGLSGALFGLLLYKISSHLSSWKLNRRLMLAA